MSGSRTNGCASTARRRSRWRRSSSGSRSPAPRSRPSTTTASGRLERFVVGKVLTRGKHPDADRLNVCTVDVGDGRSRSRSSAARRTSPPGQTVAVARPGAMMPDGTKLKKAKLRGVESNGMILAEDEVGLASDRAGGIMVLDDALAAGTPLVDVLPISTDVIELEITPNRPDCLGVYGVAREVHAATDAPLAPAPWAEDLGTPGYVAGRRRRGRGPRPVPALHRARLRERDDRPVAALAEGAPDGRRHAADQQRRRHHQLRDAAHGPARCTRSTSTGSPAASSIVRRATDGEQVDDARRPDAHARRRDARHRRRRRPDVDRRRHGRRALRGRGRHDARADGGRQLGRPQHPPHVQHPGAAQRGRRALREGPGARAGDGGPGRRDPADGRADGRRRWPAGRSTSGGERPGPDATIRLREHHVAELLGLVIPRAAPDRRS